MMRLLLWRIVSWRAVNNVVADNVCFGPFSDLPARVRCAPYQPMEKVPRQSAINRLAIIFLRRTLWITTARSVASICDENADCAPAQCTHGAAMRSVSEYMAKQASLTFLPSKPC